ncbi:hypothetical protein COV93_06435 [Candidatus Woesearchaeota archaeon CG11_big_fil_rev_8_21_14_0_20_43_8]|nr:MAG: hypothetical protein COV93_06435 [Candidatus Woesearchaeota archaeon CG11_big_fil_rev_8_21_14_0_20_43_8]PIO06688.1 MAG: hypothetical protein COT47_03130 [Candidatus Woesearchaeota archaeon CG08_land_8_20_14_0_20_43_7]
MKHFEIYDLLPVANVCDQVLREVISFGNVSMAHVLMDRGNVSLLHRHQKMTEVYFVLDGTGVLHHGDMSLSVQKGAYLVIPPKVPHKLKNPGGSRLEHLVLAIPPFDPADVEVMDDPGIDAIPEIFSYDSPLMIASDGAMVRELMVADERKQYGISLALGTLPAYRKAKRHHHKVSEEVYYVMSGSGKAIVDDKTFEVRKGSVIHVPVNAEHALECGSDDLEVLCIASPAYMDEDFLLQ